MKSYSISEVFESFEIELLNKATILVDSIPDDFCGGSDQLRCHEIARAIGFILDLPITDGKYRTIEHSWCWTSKNKPGYNPGNILDVYAIARLPMVQLVDYGSPGSFAIPNRDLYQCYPFPRGDINEIIVSALVEHFKEILH